MGIIHVLDEQLTNMIAAGEVVDRPVNIVKECVENALDAGASSIGIEVFSGGIDGVIVTDDGCGMSYDDAKMAFERHATSKISSEDELFSISTMGFRGEALPSIASVARVSLKTANKDGGTMVVYEYGDLKVHEHADVPLGTRIEVRGLFLHTPARFKYLKKPAYEFAVIADAINKIALAHPEVRFTLRHDGRMVFQTSGKSDRLEILYQMFGRDAASGAETFDARSADFHISGYAMQPNVNRASKSYIYLSLNGRTIRSWPIVNAVVEGYREFMPKERYPIVYLNIDTDFQLVDVNVHPNKLEVRISKEEYLAALISRTLRELFEEKIQAPSISEPADEKPASNSSSNGKIYVQGQLEETLSVHEPQAREYGAPKPKSENQIFSDQQKSRPNGSENRSEIPNQTHSYRGNQKSADMPAFLDPRFLNGVNQEISALSHPENTPSAPSSQRADEQNMTGRSVSDPSAISSAQPASPQSVPGQSMPAGVNPAMATSDSAWISQPQTAPVSFSQQGAPVGYPAGVSPREAREKSASGRDYFRSLRLIGQLRDCYILCEDENGLVIIDQHAAQERTNFERITDAFEQPVKAMQPLMIPLMKPVGQAVIASLEKLNGSVGRYGIHFEALNNSLVLREIPTWMLGVNVEEFVDDLISWFVDHQDVNMLELRRHVLATAACHSSIRFNHHLSVAEMEKVIEDLSHCRQPYHCPHGRPTVIRLGMKQLAKEFERA